MGVFDSGIDPSLLGKKGTKKTASTGVFDSGIDLGTETPPAKEEKKPEFFFSKPSPTARKPFGASPSGVMDEFASAISSGDFAVSGTPKAEPKKNVVDQVTRGYDQAPDKWKFKQTLSPTELARLDQTRPEHKDFGSVSESEMERQRAETSVKLQPGQISYVPWTKLEAPKAGSMDEREARAVGLEGLVLETVRNPSFDLAKKALSKAADNGTKNIVDSLFPENDTVRIQKAQASAEALVQSSERESSRRETIKSYVAEEKREPIDPTTGGEFYKALKQGLIRDVPRSFFSSVEAITAGDGSMKTVNEWAAEQSDEFLASRLLHPEENAPESMKSFLEGGYKDPTFWKRGAWQMLSTTIPSMALALGVGMVTKNPAAAWKVGLASIYAQETGQAYSDLLDSGFSQVGAQKGALIYGAVATALENVNFGKTLQKVLGTGKTEIARESFKKAVISTMKEMGETVATESATEATQEFSQNVMKRFYDENQDLFEGVVDAAVLGGMGWVGFGTVNAVTDLRNKYLSNPSEAADVAEGSKKSTEDEKEAAEIALSRYQNAVKKTEGKAVSEDGETSVTVETVKYPDGKVSAGAEVETSKGNSVTIPFSERHATKVEAVKSVVEKAKGVLEIAWSVASDIFGKVDAIPESVENPKPIQPIPLTESEKEANRSYLKEDTKNAKDALETATERKAASETTRSWKGPEKLGKLITEAYDRVNEKMYDRKEKAAYESEAMKEAEKLTQESYWTYGEKQSEAHQASKKLAEFQIANGLEDHDYRSFLGETYKKRKTVTKKGRKTIYTVTVPVPKEWNRLAREIEDLDGLEAYESVMDKMLNDSNILFKATKIANREKTRAARESNANKREANAMEKAAKKTEGKLKQEAPAKEMPKESTPFTKSIESIQAKLEKIQTPKSRMSEHFPLWKAGFASKSKAENARRASELEKTIAAAREYTALQTEIDEVKSQEAAHAKVSKRIESIRNVLESGTLKGEKISESQRKEILAVLKREEVALGRLERSKYFESTSKEMDVSERFDEQQKAYEVVREKIKNAYLWNLSEKEAAEFIDSMVSEIDSMERAFDFKHDASEALWQFSKKFGIKNPLLWAPAYRVENSAENQLRNRNSKPEQTSPTGVELDSIETFELTEGPLKGQFQAFVSNGPNKSKYGIGNTESEARSNLEASIRGEQVRPEVPKATEPKKRIFPIARESKKSANSEKLRKVAETLRARSEESLNQSRNDNTARRARMADNARENARADLEFANTLSKLADAIDNGEVKHLNGIGSKADLARLERVFRIAENKAARELKKPERELTSKEIGKFAQFDTTRAYLSKYDVERIQPSTYWKATKAGVDLKGFLKRASENNPFSIPKWEKEIEYLVKNAESVLGSNSYAVRWMGEDLTSYRALEKLKGSSDFADIFDELKMIKEGSKVVESPAEALKRKERDIVQRTQIEGFFPTPEKIVDRMIEEAGIGEWMTVLEPSAGIGSIADKIREAGVEPDVGEYSPTLSQHLTEKGYNVVASDFMDLPVSEKYDRIIMNPPFEKMQDVDHVMKAYSHLKPGGKIVAITSESPFFRSDSKATAFRDWLDSVGGYSEKLPEGTFKESLRQTGVATRMVTIEKSFEKEITELAMKWEDVSDQWRRAASSAHALNSGIGTGISKFADREVSTELTDFKLSDRVKAIIDQFETRFSRYVSPGSVGTFFPKSKNLALRSVNEVSVVHHELSHLVDDAVKVTQWLVGYRPNGRRYALDKATVKELTRIYVENYPGARKTDDIIVRVKEGYAVIQQIHLENPTRAKENYGYLYSKYVKEAVPMQKELNESMEALVRDYQSVGAKGRVWSVLSRAVNRKSGDQFLSVVERIHEFLTNHVYRFEKLDRMAAKGTLRISDMMHGSQNVQRRILKNLTGHDAGVWQLDATGELSKSLDDNISAIETEIAEMGKMDEFSIYLIVRDQFESRKRLAKLELELKDMESEGPFLSKDEEAAAETLKRKIDSLKTSIKNNEGILSKKDVEETFSELDPMFSEFGRRFDALTRSDLKAMLDAQMISKEYYDELSEQTGYAPMKRLIDDGFIGENPEFTWSAGRTGKVSKASSLKQRTGGSHDIIDPVIAYAANHKEVVMKTYKQHVMNRIYDSITQFPELSQEVRIKTTNVDGRVTRTLGDGSKLEDAPNIVIKMVDGKPKAVAVREDFSEALWLAFKPMETGTLEKFFVKSSRLFSRGTTGAYPLYTMTNVARDQQTALINTQHNYNPGALPKYVALTFYMISNRSAGDAKYSKLIGKHLSRLSEWSEEFEGPEAAFVREYLDLGGEHNTSLNFNEMTGEEILSAVTRQRSGLQKMEAMLDAGLDLLSLPSNVSEIATRVQEYVKARKSGKGKFESLELAGRLSVPFHHGGTIMKNAFSRGMVNSVPYMKAAMQGLAQYMDTATRDREGTARALSAPVVVASMMFAFLLNSLDDTDEQTRQAFLNMDAGVLGRYLFIPKGNGEFYKIPIDQSIGWLGAMNSMIWAEYKYGANYSVKEYSDAMTVWFPDQFKFWQPTKALLASIPQLLKPTLEIAMNKKTFPSVRDLESESMQKQLPYLRKHQNTSLFATELAKTSVGKQLGMSPIKIDHFLEGYLGRAIGFVTLKPSNYDIKSPFEQPEYFTSGRIIQKFYDQYGSTGTFTQMRNAIKAGEVFRTPEEKVADYARDKRADEITEDIGKLRDLEPNTGEFNEIRNRVWKNVNELLFDTVEPTEEEVAGFERSEETAQWKEEKPILVTQYVTKYKESSDPLKATRLENEMRKEIIGDVKKSDPSYSALSARATSAISAFRLERAGDDFIKGVSKMGTNKEKVAAFRKLKTELSAEEFSKRLREYSSKKLISEDLAKLIRKDK